MTSKTVVVWSCAHASPEIPNDRFDWLGEFLYDIRPDYVVDLGDQNDMKSLNSYDNARPDRIVSQNYENDIDHGLDAQERIRHKFKKNKVKRPRYYGIQGNHEERIRTAVSLDPRIEGSRVGVSFKHLQTDYFYDEYHPYEYSAPAIAEYDGVLYSHFITQGNTKNGIGGIHQPYTLINKTHQSIFVGHTHKRGIYFRDDVKSIACNVGSFKGAKESWAGQANREWWTGVVVLRHLENGYFDPEFVSQEALKKAYGK